MKRIANNEQSIISIDAIMTMRVPSSWVIVAVSDRKEALFLSKRCGYGDMHYSWLILFDNFTEHNGYTGNDHMTLRDALEWGVNHGYRMYVAENMKDLIDILGGK